MADRFDNKINHTTIRYKPTIRKVPADSVPYGESISRNGKHVWCAYDGDVLIAVAATADEARCQYREAWKKRKRAAHARVTQDE